MNFEFATAAKIVFGDGTANKLGHHARSIGHRVLVITGSTPNRYQALLGSLSDENIDFKVLTVSDEPDIDVIQTGVEIARQFQAELIIGIGGGSVIDTGKAIAAICSNRGNILDYLEVVGKGQSLSTAPLPYIAVPTTAGTGAEVTKNAVISVPDKQVKVSLRDNRMLPDIALVDPALTLTLPPGPTATTGLDALTQVIEPYLSIYANPITDALCREGIQLAGKSLRRVYQQPEQLDARTDMMLVSLLGGLALANAKLGAVHGFAGALGGRTAAAHGAICGCLLPHVVKTNIEILQAADAPMLTRYREVAVMLTGSSEADVKDLVDWIESVVTLPSQ